MLTVRGRFGQWICSDIVEGVWREGNYQGKWREEMHYYGYPKKEAQQRFRDHLKEIKGKA